MKAIILMKGTCYLGHTTTDKDGNIISSSPARFETDPDGGCVAVGEFDPDTNEISAIVPYGDYDAAGYLSAVMEAIAPARKPNIPDFKGILGRMAADYGDDIPCDYCNDRGGNCRECIVERWKEEENAD